MTILTPAQVSEYLNFSRIGIYKLLKNNKIPGAFKIGNRWGIRKETLDAHIEKAINLETPSVPSEARPETHGHSDPA